MKYARIINGTAVDVRVESPEGFYTPNIAAEFEVVPDTVENGWTLVDEEWTAPPVPPEPEPVEPQVTCPQLTPLEFKMCFTVQERIAIKAMKESDPILQDAYDILDDPRLKTVDLGLASNRGLIDYLVALNCITSERAGQIKQGIQL